MKYKFKKSAIVLQWMLVVVLALFLILYSYLEDGNIRLLKKQVITIGSFLVVFISIYSGEYINRYVEFNENHVTFNSYRIARKVRHFNVKYEDILNLEATIIPIIGIYKVKVKAKNIPWEIPVTWCISHHKEMFGKLCGNAKKGNPNVYIDERLTEYLAKRGYYEAD